MPTAATRLVGIFHPHGESDGGPILASSVNPPRNGRISYLLPVDPHLFRHSFAINFIKHSGNPWALQEIGGWADMEIIKIYTWLAYEQLKEAVMKMRFPIPYRLCSGRQVKTSPSNVKRAHQRGKRCFTTEK